MSALGNLAVSLTMDTLEFTKGIDRSSHEAQKFQQKLERNLNKTLGEVKGSMVGLGAQAAALAAGFIGVGSAAQAFVDKINSMDRLVDVSAKIGATVESLSALQYAAQLSGSSAEELEKGLVQLNKAAAAAAGGVGEQADAFRALGVSVIDSNGKIKSTERLLLDASERFSRLSDGADKTAIAMQLFGKAGADLVPFLNNGAQGIQDLTEEAKLFGAVVGADAAESAAKFNDNLDRLKAVSGGLAKEFASAVLPSINDFTDKTLRAIKATGSFTDAINLMVNNAFNSSDPAARVRELNVELRSALKNFNAYSNTSFRGTVFESWYARKVVEKQQQLDFANAELNDLIDGANKPPSNSAAARQRIQNEQDAKDAADKALRTELQAAEARKQASAEEAEIRKNASAAMRLLLADMANYAEATQKQLELDRQASQEAANYRAGEVDRIDARRFAIEGEIEQIEFETSLIGKSADEIARLTEEREAEAIAILEQDIAFKRLLPGREFEIEAIEREIDARKRLTSARGASSAAQEAQRSVDAQNKVYEDLYRDVARGLTDSIFRGFESGKKFISSFKDAIKNAFKSLIIKFPVQPVLGSAIGGIAGSLGLTGLAQAAQKELGGIGSIASNVASGGSSGGSGFGLSEVGGVKSLYDLFQKGMTGISTSITTGLNSFATSSVGQSLGLSYGNMADGGVFVKPSVGSATSTIGTYATAAGIAYGGYSLGKGVSGGYSLNGGTGNGLVNAGAIVGAVLGAGNPISIAIGSAIGSVVGGAVNRAFGRKTVLGASGLQGTFTDNGFSGRSFQDVQQKGGLFRSDKNSTSYGSVPTETLDAFAQTLIGISKAAKSAGLALGRDLTKGIEAFSLSGRFTGSFEKIASQVSDALVKSALGVFDETTTTRGTSGFARFFSKTTTKEVGTSENLAFLGYLRELKTASENLLQVMARVAGAVTDANSAAILLGQGIKFSIANAREAVAFQSNLGDLTKNLESVLSSFIPAADLAARRVALMDEQLRTLGLDGLVSVKTTREEFGKLLESRNITTESGQRELALLLQIAPAIDSIIKQRESEATALAQQAALIEQQTQAIRDQIAAQQAVRIGQISEVAANRDQFLAASGIVQSGGNVMFEQERFRIPAFASGGDFGGGIALVGERGPEIIATGPARIFNAGQTSQMMGGTDKATAAEIAQLRADLRASQTAIAGLQNRMVRIFERWDGNGLPEVRNVA